MGARAEADARLQEALTAISPLLGALYGGVARVWAQRESRWRFPLHGNWCGPGVGRGPCLSVIDCLCQAHDEGYDEDRPLTRPRS